MKIKSITDVVTNSSSEVYVIKTGMTEKEFRKILLEITKDCIGCSGMGGIMDIHTNQSPEKDGLDWEWLPENCLGLHIDYGYDLKKIKEHLESLGCEYLVPETLRDNYYTTKANEVMKKLEASTSQAEITRLYDVWGKLIAKIEQ